MSAPFFTNKSKALNDQNFNKILIILRFLKLTVASRQLSDQQIAIATNQKGFYILLALGEIPILSGRKNRILIKSYIIDIKYFFMRRG